ncbi:hypothetical protein BGZ91_011838 [Linnemannia elongata]|nr:hypothetical protein BGZ91_011838 [Linnemannia elongata]
MYSHMNRFVTTHSHGTALATPTLLQVFCFFGPKSGDWVTLNREYSQSTATKEYRSCYVKWVCFEHYKETYRHTAISSSVQSIETAGGTYDPHLGQVTINLKSGTTSKGFFRLLATQAPAVQTLDVTLDWDIGPADLVTLVDMISKSNAKVVKLDFRDDHTSNAPNATIASLLPASSLQFSNLYLLGSRTSNLSSRFSATWLQSFCFYGRINNGEDRKRLAKIISHCPQLVDLRLVNESLWFMELSLQQAVFSLKKLRRLHLRGWELRLDQDADVNDPQPIKEIVYYTVLEDVRFLTMTIRQLGPVLEVLVLHSGCRTEITVDIGPEDPSSIPLLGEPEGAPAEPLSNVLHLSALTHLDLSIPLTRSSLNYLSTVLPRLNLVHFGFHLKSYGLLQYCNLASLESLSMVDDNDTDVNLLLDTKGDGPSRATWDRLEQLYIRGLTALITILTHFLKRAQLTRLYLETVDLEPLAEIFKAVNLSKLQEISICRSEYSPSAERVLASRINECTESLVVRLDDSSFARYLELGGKPRTVVGSSETLPRHRTVDAQSLALLN